MKFAAVLSNALLGTALVVTATTAFANRPQCMRAELQALAPKGTAINAAKLINAETNLPEHCLVDGTVTTPGNTANFQLALPTEWNGKFLFQGVGGFAGSLGRLNDSIKRGYAAATTDTGHQSSSGTDGRWALNDRPKEIDYGHRATHLTTVAAQQLTRAFYGSKPRYAYFNGCSNGGRQALMEAQRYPDDFDGIVAGDPSFGAMGYVRRGLNYQFMLKSADHVIPAAKLDVLSRAATATCDKSDGLADGLISDPRQCSFDPTPLLCQHGDAADCLTAGQLASVKMLYADIPLPNGERLRGYPVGHETGTSGWQQWITGRSPPTQQADGSLSFDDATSPTGFRFADGFFRYMAFEQDDPNYDWRNFDLAHDLSKINTISTILSPSDANLKSFGTHGKKLLLYHGWADPALSAYGTIDYYNNVVSKVGGKQKADDFVRLFLAPGMHHCRGGPGPDSFDTLTALEQWVENGTAPKMLIASHSTNGKVDRTRPLCPEPQVAKYIGSGDINAAENFRCETPGK